MKVLVIGATGYIGSVVAGQLRREGHQVVALLRTPRSLPAGVALRVADLVTLSQFGRTRRPTWMRWCMPVLRSATGTWKPHRSARC